MAFPSLADPERERVLAEARVQGHAAGYAAGKEAARLCAEDDARTTAENADRARVEARELLNRQLAILAAAAEAMHERAVPVLETMEKSLAGAALDIAETVIGCELADGETSVRAALARALNPVTPAPVHTVRLHPQDLAALPSGTAAEGVRFRADPSLQPGDAVAEYTDGFLDARTAAALARIRTALLEGTE